MPEREMRHTPRLVREDPTPEEWRAWARKGGAKPEHRWVERGTVEWQKTTLFCPFCGKQDLWRCMDLRDDGHDYVGRCFSCESEMCCVPEGE